MKFIPAHFRQLLPVKIRGDGERILVDWCFAGEKRLTEPFYEDSVRVLRRENFSHPPSAPTPIEFMEEICRECEIIPPKGFIFHISRCGSTLVSQMLAALPNNIVISESPLLDAVCRAETFFPKISETQKIEYLRWLIGALGKKRNPAEEHLFIKFDSWAVLDFDLIEKAFPHVPWIFVYRQPLEVIVSHQREPGIQMIPAEIRTIFPELSLEEILCFSTEERFARTIARFLQAGKRIAEKPSGKLINYRQLPAAFGDEILRHFGVSFSEAQVDLMNEATRFHAKNPLTEFTPDAAEKRSAAMRDLQETTKQIVQPIYEEVERARQRKNFR